MSGMMMHSGSNGGDLAWTASLASLILVNPIREILLLRASIKSDPYNLISSHNFPPQFVVLVVRVFNVSVCDLPGIDYTAGPLAIVQDLVKI